MTNKIVSSNQNNNAYLRPLTFMKTSKEECFNAVIKGFSHDSFADLALFTKNGEKKIILQRDLILQFFNKYLKNDELNFDKIELKYSEILIDTKEKICRTVKTY